MFRQQCIFKLCHFFNYFCFSLFKAGLLFILYLGCEITHFLTNQHIFSTSKPFTIIFTRKNSTNITYITENVTRFVWLWLIWSDLVVSQQKWCQDLSATYTLRNGETFNPHLTGSLLSGRCWKKWRCRYKRPQIVISQWDSLHRDWGNVTQSFTNTLPSMMGDLCMYVLPAAVWLIVWWGQCGSLAMTEVVCIILISFTSYTYPRPQFELKTNPLNQQNIIILIPLK